ncbi:hypothetical protein C8P63_10757 [Melghirimyces profundicolus]|uniref:UPF0122 protein C8P63_10757 n=1 Tax=Melghirimyces profundicolus TaxID=1242148 RepID=A0A2T6BYW9_9BACL|nr:YlxM family DNA-binding protein [Melghirimyces profundicolus]PTX61262.1 hypothetical protein C8P63_10757 [Melghirimyces profundicolus]
MLDETTRMNLLYDFYGPLLTGRQRNVMELYFHEDWSFGEIADHLGISRQGVFEAVKRSRTVLEDLEKELGLLSKHIRRKEIAEAILDQLEGLPEKEAVRRLLDELLELD